jgi:protein SCO1/2
MKPAIPIIVTSIVAVVVLIGATLVWQRSRTLHDGHTPLPAAEADAPPAFTLVDADGRTVTDADLHGRIALVYFGFTTCPDVCPTELAWMARVLRALGPAGERVQPVFVTVDPERDSVEKLRGYATLFHPRFRSLTGTPAQVAAAAAAFGVIYRKNVPVSGQPGFYLIDHTMTTYVLATDGRIVHRLASHDLAPADAADLIRPLIGASP